MAGMKDFYYILGVNPGSTLLEIIEAYEKLSPKFDPVLNGHDSYYTKQFNEVREAFHVLTDPAKRKLYDEQLNALNSSTTTNQHKKSLASSVTPKIDITFSLVLILLTGVFGTYVYRSIYKNTKKELVTTRPVVSTPPVIPAASYLKPKKHFKHKALLANNATYTVRPVTASAIQVRSTVPISYTTSKNNTPVNYAVTKSASPVTSYAVSKPVVTPRVEATTEEEPSNEAEVRTNETGVVYLREYAQFRAPVIKTLQDRAKIIILEKGIKYYKVQSADLIGYIPKWAVQPNEQE